MFHGRLDPQEVVPDDKSVIAEAARVAEATDWDSDPWHRITDALKASTGRKGRALFHPLRKVLTGRDSGPEMGPMLQLIGKDRAVERLRAAAS